MKRYVALTLAVVVALLGAGGLISSAQAQPAAYPTPVVPLKLSLQVVVAGHPLTVTVSPNPCAPLTVTFAGQRATASQTPFSHTFTAPTVTKPTVFPLVAVCVYVGTSGTSGAAIQATARTITRTVNVTVLPAKHGATSGLPNTGGPSLGWFVGGIAAVILGLLAVLFGRRRRGDGIAH